MKLVIATRNLKKEKELKTLLKNLNIKVVSLRSFKSVPRVKEGGKTFKENAKKKAAKIAQFTDCLTLADDSGLEVEALGGAPGVYSSRFSGKGANDKKNIKKLLKVLEGIPKRKRKARFVCVIALAKKNKVIKIIRATARGMIADVPKGSYGFGYDPVFIPSGYKKTFAQLNPRIKNRISHRAKALKKTKSFLASITT